MGLCIFYLPVCTSVCLSLCLFVYLSVCPYVCMFVCLPIFLSKYLYIYPIIYLPIHIYPPLSPSVGHKAENSLPSYSNYVVPTVYDIVRNTALHRWCCFLIPHSHVNFSMLYFYRLNKKCFFSHPWLKCLSHTHGWSPFGCVIRFLNSLIICDWSLNKLLHD